MSHVAVEKVNEKKGGAASLLDEVKALSDRIRQRAYELYLQREGNGGSPEQDWLRAVAEISGQQRTA